MSEFLKVYPDARQVTLDAVITGWLSAGGLSGSENDSERYDPVPKTAAERYEKLVCHGDLFLRFIPACDWFEVRFDPAWFTSLKLIEEESWNHGAVGGERRLAKRTDLSSLHEPHRVRVERLFAHPALPALLDRQAILFGHSPLDEWSILDGNHRLLALACQHQLAASPIAPFSIFVGISFGPCRWHGDPVVWQERPERTPGEKRYVLKVW